ncbi:MAG TPA: hypothetical protein VNR89_04190 [Roseomonas sp.]|nr:hypothetical protein [Roseomonas sp.]
MRYAAKAAAGSVCHVQAGELRHVALNNGAGKQSTPNQGGDNSDKEKSGHG